MENQETKKTKVREENPIIYITMIIELKDKENKRDIETERIENTIKAYSKYYAMIEHDKDYDEEKNKKRNHLHVIMELKHRQRPLTLIKKISEELNININRISVRPLRNEQLATQYLIHMNNPEKSGYLQNEIMTNDEERLNDNLSDTNGIENLTANKLINIVKKTQNKIQIMRMIGLKNYNRYIRVIDMLLDEAYFNYKFQAEILEAEEKEACADKKN